MLQEPVTLCSIHFPANTIKTYLQSRCEPNVKGLCQGCKHSQQHDKHCKPCWCLREQNILTVLTRHKLTLSTAPLSSASTQTSTGFIASAGRAIMLLFKLPVQVLFGTASLL